MAVRKKKVTKKTANKKPAPSKAAAPSAPVAPRTKVLICGKPFYTDSAHAAAMIPFEAASRGMSRDEFADFVSRYGLKIELWQDATSNVKVALTDGQNILGNWI